jgi:hypothetical protein
MHFIFVISISARSKVMKWKKRVRRRKVQQMHKGKKDNSEREKPWQVGAERYTDSFPSCI